jgi:hypothetical protein
MNQNDFICVYSTSREDEIAFIKSLLDAEKVLYYIRNESISSRVKNALDREMHVMVSDECREQAKEILKEFLEKKN